MSSKRRALDHSVSRSPSRIARAVLLAAVLIAPLVACGTSVPSPSSDLSTGQAILDIGTQLGQIREDNALLQAQIDSLHGVVAYQDTILRQLAAGAGVAMRPPVVPVP